MPRKDRSESVIYFSLNVIEYFKFHIPNWDRAWWKSIRRDPVPLSEQIVAPSTSEEHVYRLLSFPTTSNTSCSSTTSRLQQPFLTLHLSTRHSHHDEVIIKVPEDEEESSPSNFGPKPNATPRAEGRTRHSPPLRRPESRRQGLMHPA